MRKLGSYIWHPYERDPAIQRAPLRRRVLPPRTDSVIPDVQWDCGAKIIAEIFTAKKNEPEKLIYRASERRCFRRHKDPVTKKSHWEHLDVPYVKSLCCGELVCLCYLGGFPEGPQFNSRCHHCRLPNCMYDWKQVEHRMCYHHYRTKGACEVTFEGYLKKRCKRFKVKGYDLDLGQSYNVPAPSNGDTSIKVEDDS